MTDDLGRVASEFRERGLAHALTVYDEVLRTRPIARVLAGVSSPLLPVRRIIQALLDHSADIERQGIAAASRTALVNWDVPLQIDIDASTWNKLHSEAIVAFGNHPTGAEVLMFNGLLHRDDVYHLGGDHIARVSDALAKHVIPVANSAQRVSSLTVNTLRDRILGRIEAVVWPPTDHEDAGAINRLAIQTAARLVAEEGAALHVFPAGSMNSSAPWLNGLGAIVGTLSRRTDDSRPVYLVPVVYRVSETHLMASRLFPPTSPVRCLARLQLWACGHPPTVHVGRAIRLDDLELSNQSAATITQGLRAVWCRLAEEATATNPGWIARSRGRFTRART